MEGDAEIGGGEEGGVLFGTEPGGFDGDHFEFVLFLEGGDLGEVVLFLGALAGDYGEDLGELRVGGYGFVGVFAEGVEEDAEVFVGRPRGG